MAIECYDKTCKHHGCNETPPDEGPFCHEFECHYEPIQKEDIENNANRNDSANINLEKDSIC